MHLLVTPALPLSAQQKEILSRDNALYFIQDERIPLAQQQLDFDPQIIEGIICNFFFVYNDISVLPNLKMIQLTSVGLDRVPLAEMKDRGIAIFNAGAAYAVPMAEWAVAKILEVFKTSRFFYWNQQNKIWEKNRKVRELFGANVSIIGFGNLGREIAKRLKAFGTIITAVDIFGADNSGLSDQYYPISDLKNALENADVVILCLPLTESSYHIVNRDTLSQMKPGALLMNLSRGKLVDENSVVEQLRKDPDFVFSSDVFEVEPLQKDSPLWEMDRVLITPHNSFVGNHNGERLFDIIVTNIHGFLDA